MAGIEKVCEFSGEYPGSDMYIYKRNHIQIDPKYRKLFRGCDAELVVVQRTYLITNKRCMVSRPLLYGDRAYSDDRIIAEYEYELRVKDPSLQGEVNGRYLNWSKNIKAVLRKMRRLTRNYKMEIKYEIRNS